MQRNCLENWLALEKENLLYTLVLKVQVSRGFIEYFSVLGFNPFQNKSVDCLKWIVITCRRSTVTLSVRTNISALFPALCHREGARVLCGQTGAGVETVTAGGDLRRHAVCLLLVQQRFLTSRTSFPEMSEEGGPPVHAGNHLKHIPSTENTPFFSLNSSWRPDLA